MTRRIIGVVLFDQFEMLDVFGPLEMFGGVPDAFEIRMLAEHPGSVASTQGPRSVVDQTFDEVEGLDLVLVPGGLGTRREVENQRLLDWLTAQASDADFVASVCTGSAVLAAAGLLDGRRATSNKKSFGWVTSCGPKVQWAPQARWVADGKFWTAGGVAAGIDMGLALMAEIVGEEGATKVAEATEYEWHRDAGWDPFAKLAGLV